MKRFSAIVVICWMFVSGVCLAGEDTLTQISTIDALMTGVYEGETTLGQLKEKGDFGLGTFNALDGEMVLLDGVFYQVKSTGDVLKPALSVRTPFAAVTFFEADKSFPLKRGLAFREFTALADGFLPTSNIFYAFKVTGTFRTMKTRSVPAQAKPYRPLSEVVKTQPVFEFSNVRGTIIGFKCPSFVKGVNVPGYHLHFLSADLKKGGHILDFIVDSAIVEIDDTREFYLILPRDSAFDKANLEPDRGSELKAVEK